MSNVKVKGVLDENGVKNFIITNKDTGESHVAMRHGQFSFSVGEFTGTLKQCKQLVSANEVVHFADAPPEPEDKQDTWGCVDPCALLIIAAAGGHVSDDEINRTLDAHGWIKPDGERDSLHARENLEKWSKR